MRDLDLRLVRYFVAVAHTRHFGRAAARLYITQPALSQAIVKLESQLGVKLLERTNRSVELTPVGCEFLTEAERLLRAAQATMSVAHRGRRDQKQIFRVGFIAGPGEMMGEILKEAERRLPQVTVETSRLEWRDQETAVVTGRVDVSFARAPVTHPALSQLQVSEEGRVVGMARTHPLATRDSLHIDEIAHEPMITTATAPSEEWRLWWAVSPRPDGTPVTWGPTVDTIEELLEAASRGHGIFTTAAHIARCYRLSDVVFVPLTGVPSSAVQLCWLRESRLPLLRDFLAVARQVVAAREKVDPRARDTGHRARVLTSPCASG